MSHHNDTEILLKKLQAITDEIELSSLRHQQSLTNQSLEDSFCAAMDESFCQWDSLPSDSHTEAVEELKGRLLRVAKELLLRDKRLAQADHIERQLTLENQKLAIELELEILEKSKIEQMLIEAQKWQQS